MSRSICRIASILVVPLFMATVASAAAPASDDPNIGGRNEGVVKITSPEPGQQMSILAEANLNASRPAAPVNFTGTWRMQRSATNTPPDWEFWPMPKLTAKGQDIYNQKLQADADGVAFQDSAALCYPPGMPRFLTRVWPMQIIQLPTAIIMIHGFENQIRWIYMDGRGHKDPDFTLPTWNGDSIGHWEGKTLVVDTRNFEPEHHWIQAGVPVGEQLRIVERWTLNDAGTVMAIQLSMTDPEHWEGEWVNTKHFNLRDDVDLSEIHCIAAEMANLPSARPSANR